MFGHHVLCNFDQRKDSEDCTMCIKLFKEYPYKRVKEMFEKDPNGRNPHQSGAKLDNGKSPVFAGLLSYFPRACLAVAEVSEEGAKKYTWKGWVDVPNGITRYSNAMGRHILKEEIEGLYDLDDKLLHAAHTAWNALAVLELKLMELETSKAEELEARTGNQSYSARKSIETYSTDPDLSPGL